MKMQTSSTDSDVSGPLASWKVNHVGIFVDDIDAAIAWYTETFDFRLVRRWSLGSKWFGWLSPAGGDDVIIELLAGSERGGRPPPTDAQARRSFRPHAGFRVDSVDDTIAELLRRGVTIVSEPYDVEPVGRRIAFFVDPWGNLFEVTQTIGS
jgi:catechol 2,3-dioxygenase-like lactoylglutathione lyase family enzyme